MPEAASLRRDQWTWSKCNKEGLGEFQALIINYFSKTVLLHKRNGQIFLPGYLGAADSYSSCYNTQFVCSTLVKVIGGDLKLVVLRQVWREEMRIIRERVEWENEKAVILLEVQGPPKHVMMKEGFFWAPLKEAEVAKIFHLFPEALRVIRKEIHNALYEMVPTNRLHWQRPGWSSRTLSWVRDVLKERRGICTVSRIIPERLSPYGVVLELQTPGGRFFVKSTPPYSDDASYMEQLSYLAPDFVCPPLAINKEQRLMLTADFGPILEPCEFEENDHVNLTADYAQLQKISSRNVDRLIAAGMPDMRVKSLSAQLNSIASHPVLKEILGFEGMENPVRSFSNISSKLQEEAYRLESSGIPPSVTHNDLYWSNVYKPKDSTNYMFFDFVEGYVSHPFASSFAGLDRAAYLEAWREFGSTEFLSELMKLGARVRITILFILTVREVEHMEEPERKDSLRTAARHLKSLYKRVEKEYHCLQYLNK